jgi:hypothetical protein
MECSSPPRRIDGDFVGALNGKPSAHHEKPEQGDPISLWPVPKAPGYEHRDEENSQTGLKRKPQKNLKDCRNPEK